MDTLEHGYTWESEAVSKRFGPNDSDKRIINDAAQILVINDLDKFRVEFGDSFLIAMADGTSVRVMCQRVGRTFKSGEVAANQAAVINAIKGVRTRGATIPKRPLADGTFYHGTNETEYRAKYAASLVDAGVDGSLALTIAARLPF
jgi:hypothetical protein